MEFATDNEILHAHELLLKGLPDYEDEHLAIIKSNISQYFQACPGSGKTTTLLAKLIILANRMPFANGKGICVLTHTNVAIDEIKAKIGQQANTLFQYPNFFGTIQTFIHKYIVKQALFYYYGSRIEYVDDDIYYTRLYKKIWSDKDDTLKRCTYASACAKEYKLNIEEIKHLGDLEKLMNANVIKEKGIKSKYFIFSFKYKDYDNTILSPFDKNTIYEFRKTIINTRCRDFIRHIYIDNDKKVNIEGLTFNCVNEYIRIKEELFSEGILSYNDAYNLAFRYIHDIDKNIKDKSSNRFQYLFIDEVQDCSTQQLNLIKLVFDDAKTISQKFGDYCQAIYDKDNIVGNTIPLQNINKLTKSNRFGELIAKPLRTICIEDNVNLRANLEIPSLKPVIIVFSNPKDVLPKYVELLNSKRVSECGNKTIAEISKEYRRKDPLHRINLKACGWRSKEISSHLSLASYYPMYNHKTTIVKGNFDCMEDYLIIKKDYNPKDYANSILDSIIQLLREANITNGTRWYSKTTLLERLDKNDSNLKKQSFEKIMHWVSMIINKESVVTIKESIYKYLQEIIVPILGATIELSNNDFYNRHHLNTESGDTAKIQNVYSKDGLDIEISTVHKVKGETHISTLYMETFYERKYESEFAGSQIQGSPYTGSNAKTLTALKVMYVGMSRPRYFLCFAIEQSRFNVIDCGRLREIWDVVTI